MKTVATTNAPAALGPYAQAQVSGGFVFTSGQIGIDPATGAIAEGIEAQAHQVFRNLTAVLQAAGSDMSKAVKTTVFIKNMDDFATVNTIYAGYFSEPFPARSCVEVARLPKDVLVECEVIAEAEAPAHSLFHRSWLNFPLPVVRFVHIDHKMWEITHFSVFLFDNPTALC